MPPSKVQADDKRERVFAAILARLRLYLRLLASTPSVATIENLVPIEP
jgi:hypothetical protein